MGLDMYLNKKHYVQNWSFQAPEEQHEVIVKKGGKVVAHINPARVNYIEEQVMYWRKFNALHNWFVENVQGGEDNCQVSYVSTSQLEELLKTLKQVEASLEVSPKVALQVECGWKGGEKMYEEIQVFQNTAVAERLFPTASGFFFGGTEYDEYYLQQVKETIVMLEAELAVDYGEEYLYHASW